MSKFLDDVAAEGKRLTVQGSMEFANALFNGSAFVPYGPGAYTKTPQHEQEKAGHDQPEMVRENEGMER